MNLEITPRTGNSHIVPALRFVNWKEAQEFFRAQQSTDYAIEETRVTLASTGVAVMTFA